MSSARRLAPVIFAALALGGCGFHPLYGNSGPRGADATGTARIRLVEVDPIANRSGQILRNYLVDRIGAASASPIFHLGVTLTEQKANTGIARDSSATFAEIVEVADFHLVEIATGKTVMIGQSVARDSYSLITNGFGTLSAESNARGQVIDTIGDDIINRVALFLGKSD